MRADSQRQAESMSGFKRAELKSQLTAKGVTIPVDTVTSELEKMLKAASARPAKPRKPE